MGLSGDVTSLVLVVLSLNTLKLATGAVTVNLTITPSSQVQPGATVYLNCEVWTNDTFGALPTLLQQNGSEVPAHISHRPIDDSTILYYTRIENVVTSTCYTCKAVEWFSTAPPATMNACVNVTTAVDQVHVTTTVDQVHVISNDSEIILDLNGSDDYSFTLNLTVSVENFYAVEEDLSVTTDFSPQPGIRLSVLEYYSKTHTELTIQRLNGTVYVYSLNINLVSLVNKLKGSFEETLIWTLRCHNTSKVHKYTVKVIPDENVVKDYYASTSTPSEGLRWTPLEVLMLVISFVSFIIFIAAGIVTLVLLVRLRNYRRQYLQNVHQQRQFPEERSKGNTWKKFPRVRMCYSCFCTACRKEHSTHGDTVELQDVTNDSCTL